MKRIYHPFWLWEDIEMWRKIPANKEREMLQKAIEFTGDHVLYGQWMLRVANQWPVACEQNLTDDGINQRAWIGHAATQMAINCPEYITRSAWGHLSKQQQNLANQQADIAIHEWNKARKKTSGQLYLEMA
jgi:hypothetical protein